MNSQSIVRPLAAGLFLSLVPSVVAQLNIPSDGTDSALIVSSNTVIDLSRAVTGIWSNAVSLGNAGKGIYDSNKWAVVFKYSSVTISNDATLTFANHPSRAPVVWLVQGDVRIDGTLNLDGQNDVDAPGLAEPGPGGFRGGQGHFSAGVSRGSGFGVGGGVGGNWGYGGAFGTRAQFSGDPYGNPSLLPLIGGSGGGGYQYDGRGGGAGGGAILIASAGTITVGGILRANGGNQRAGGGVGSGGGIRLVAGAVSGNGAIQCLPGTGGYAGGYGRIRIERVTSSGNVQVTPDPSVVPLQAGTTPLLWLPTDGPTVRIVSIGGTNAPADPRASFGTFGPDVSLPQVATTPVVVETVNAEDASIVKVRVTPRSDADHTETTATLSQIVSTSPLVIRWTANVPVTNGYSALQVKVVRP